MPNSNSKYHMKDDWTPDGVLQYQQRCRRHRELIWNSQHFSSFAHCFGSKSLRQIKDGEWSILYLCLCCVWLSSLFSSGRQQAGIKVKVALNMDLCCSTHTLTLSWRHYHTQLNRIPFWLLKKYQRQNTQRRVYTVYWRRRLSFFFFFFYGPGPSHHAVLISQNNSS